MASVFSTQDFNVTSYSCELALKRAEVWNVNATMVFIGEEAVERVEAVQDQIQSNYTAFVETVSNSTGMSAPQVSVSYNYSPNEVSAGSLILICYVWIVALFFIVV